MVPSASRSSAPAFYPRTPILLATLVFFAYDPATWLMLAGQGLCFILYAVPPFRWKNHPWLALVTDSTYAHLLPHGLMLYTLFQLSPNKHVPWQYVVVLGLWQGCVGARHYVQHLCADVETDKLTRHQTLATLRGCSRIRHLVAGRLLPLEMVALLGVLCVPLMLYPVLGVGLGFLVLIKVAETFWLGGQRHYTFQDNVIDGFYAYGLPLCFLFSLVWYQPAYGFLVPLHLLLYVPMRTWRLPLWRPFFRLASVSVNYGLYYGRRYVLFRSEQGARRAHYADYVQRQVRRKKSQTCGAIALFNSSEHKYTETYVHALREKLPFGVHYFYGDPFPAYEAQRGHLVSENPIWRQGIKLWELLTGQMQQGLSTALIGRLFKLNIQCLLAEFGTMGAQLLSIQAQTGLPLIVYFHGYDAYQRQTLERHQHLYAKLFQQAAHVLCVSKDMEKQLLSLGAPGHKLSHLPAYVDTDRFRYSDHSQNQKRLLFVGRFCNTKAPYLLLLALAKVVECCPEVRLVMVGTDEKGELYEACHVLVRSLRLQDHVRFVGILSPQQVRVHMEEAYALVLPSLTTPLAGEREGTPVVLMEAAFSGLPVIATKHAGALDLFVDKESALLVDEYSVEQLTEAMLHVLQSPRLARKLALRAQQTLTQHPLIPQHVKHLSRIIKQHISSAT